MALYTVTELRKLLRNKGELHVYFEDGGEAHLHKHDVEIEMGGTINIDSVRGSWRVPVGLVSGVELPESEYHPPE